MRVERALSNDIRFLQRHKNDGQLSDCRGRQLLEITVWFSILHHLFAVGIERIVNDPLGSIDLVIVFVAEMPKAFGNSFKSRSFRLTIERVVRVSGIDDLSEKDKRKIIRKLIFFQDSLE
jgi:hypothetical protein